MMNMQGFNIKVKRIIIKYTNMS